MSVSPVGTVSIPDPGAYTYPADLPIGLTSPIGGAATSTFATTTTPAKQTPVQAEYQLLQQYDTAELIQVSFFDTPAQAQANAQSVFAQVAALQDQAQAARQQHVQANADANVLRTQSTSTSTPATDVSKLPLLSDLISQSDAAANQVLTSYGNAPSGSTILDYQA